MSQTMIAVVGVALLVSAAMWLSLRATTGSDLTVLPLYCRRRVRWWQANSRYVYLACAVAAVAGVAIELGRRVG